MSTPGPIAVVGAGMAGLTAAHVVRQAGHEVIVIDGAAVAGGMVRSSRRGEWLFEGGPHLVSGLSEELMTLVDQTGVDRVTSPAASGRRYLAHEGKPVPVPTSASEFLGSPLLSVAGRLRLLREPFVPRGDGEEESVATFARRRLGEEASRRFIEPVVAAATAGDPELLMAKYAVADQVRFESSSGSILKGRLRSNRIARRGGSRAVPAWSTAEGVAGLPRCMSHALGDSLRLEQTVTAVRRDRGRFEIVLESGEVVAAAGVVMALPAPALARLSFEAVGNQNLSELSAIPHKDVAVVSLGYGRAQVGHPLDGLGVVVPAGSGLAFRSVIFDSSLFTGRAPAGHVLVSCQVGGIGRPAPSELSDPDLVALVSRDVAGLLGISGQPVESELSRWPNALPLAVAGHTSRLAQAEHFERTVPGVVFSGAWHDGPSLVEVMQGGASAARRLLKLFDSISVNPDPEF